MTDPTPTPTPAPTPVPPAPTPVVETIAEQIAADVLALLGQQQAWKTAPFWVTVATMILGILVATGILKPDVAASANVQEIVQLTAGIAAIVIPPAVYAVGHFISQHALVPKKAALKEQIKAVVASHLRTA